MNSITADLVPFQSEDAIRAGKANMLCPACHAQTIESELESYFEEGSERKIELCTNCREEFEADNELTFDSDTLEADTFQQLWAFATAAAEQLAATMEGLNENTAPIVAKALGGDAWQSGGGIWLVLIHKPDGKLVVISDDVICEYASEAAFDNCNADTAITLR